MLRNYFKIAWRTLIKSRIYSAINIIGLAISLTACILILLWVQDEMSYDSFHKNAGSIYKVSVHFKQDGQSSIWSGIPAPAAIYGKKEIPGIEDACRMTDYTRVNLLQYKDQKFYKLKCGVADASFFSMFSFPIVNGNDRQPFTDDLSVVLSETTAKKFFGDEDPIGKSITADDKKEYHVTGVMKDIPSNSSISYDLIFNFDILKRDFDGQGSGKSLDRDWEDYFYRTYFLINPLADIDKIAQQLKQIHRANHGGDASDPYFRNINYLFLPLTQTHLYAADGQEEGMRTVRIFFIIAFIILLIACINYVNMVTARAIKRTREISLRKIIGAERASLFWQFLSEAFLIFFISLLAATALVYLLMPVYNALSGKQLVFNPLQGNVLTVYAVTLIATLIMAGIYPAITLSSFRPLEAMKGKLPGIGSKGTFRKALVVTQFTVSIMFIVGTLVISKQLKYIREKNLGYEKENILTAGNIRNISDHYDAVKADLLKQPGVLEVTASGGNIMKVSSSTGDVDWDGKTEANESFVVTKLNVEKDFLKIMGIPLLQGNGFAEAGSDSAKFILNETAIKEMGMKDPVGKRFKLHDTSGTIVGVVKDFHFKDLHSKIRPIILFHDTQWHGNWIYVKTSGEDASKAIAALSQVWKKYNPDYAFDYHFLDDSFDEMYKTDIRTGKMFSYFAIITILISCLGLFGLVSYTAESKIKEIGIRKVLGASAFGIVNMLSKDFLKLIAIAAAIAFPAAWWILNDMLQEYSYRTDIGVWVFVFAGGITLIIALATISFQAIKAAVTNPMKSLRTE